jgi:uncharacterized membrane protein
VDADHLRFARRQSADRNSWRREHSGGVPHRWPSIIAVILNYVKRSDVRGTWLESHFRWQIRTFWFGLLWISLCLLFIVMTLGIGLIVAWLPIAIVSLWFIYRVVRGWLALNNNRPMYM